MNRKKLILAILLVILGIALVYTFFHQPKQQRAGSLKFRPGSVAGIVKPVTSNAGSIKPDDKRLHLELLEKEVPLFAGYKRNIFQPIFKDELRPLPFRPLPPVSKPVLPLPPPPQFPTPPVSPPVSETAIVQRDMAKLTFLGFLKKGGQKTVFLSSNKEVFVVRSGDTVLGKYKITSITDESLTIHPLAGGEDLIIPLIENKSLGLSKINELVGNKAVVDDKRFEDNDDNRKRQIPSVEDRPIRDRRMRKLTQQSKESEQ